MVLKLHSEKHPYKCTNNKSGDFGVVAFAASDLKKKKIKIFLKGNESRHREKAAVDTWGIQ